MSRYYLGIDGGQSSTTALIADEFGRVIGRGSAGPCNHVSDDHARERFSQAITDCAEQALKQAGVAGSAVFAAACLGFSGGAADKEAYSRELISAKRFKITHDAEIALTGGTAGEPGIVVIAGTGSMAFGRNAEGRTARAGGWGYVFGDEGGAFDIVRRALRAALQFEEGWGRETALHDLLLQKTGSLSANDLLHRCYAEIHRNGLAALAPLVTRAAEESDEIAIEIVEVAASSLAWYVGGVYRNLFAAGDCINVVYIGGVFQSSSLRAKFSARIAEITGSPARAPALSPAAGALLEALRMDGNGAALSAVPESEK